LIHFYKRIFSSSVLHYICEEQGVARLYALRSPQSLLVEIA